MPGKIFLSTPGGGGTSYPYTPADVAGSTGPLTVLGGTLTGASTPFLNLSQTWNNAATTFTGVLVNVTDTASNASSLFADYQVAGSSKLSILKTGKIQGNAANPYLFLDNAVGSQLGYGTGVLNNAGSSVTWSASGTEKARIDNAGLVSVASGGAYQWSSTTASSGTKDLILLRVSAGVLGLQNSTNAQEFQVYGTTTGSKYASVKHDGTNALFTTTAGQIAFASAANATGATTGYLTIPTSAGAPTGVPASVPTGQVAFQYDSTNNKLYIYNGAWKSTAALT